MSRILLIEDDEAFRYATAKLLADEGYQVVEARDFNKALAVLEDGSSVDLLIVDAVLPGVNGFALARMARMRHPDIACIYMSGYDVPIHEAIGPILYKPFTDSELLRLVALAIPGLARVSYRMFFLDGEGGFKASHKLRAEDDAEAMVLAAVLGDACSDVYAGYELWDAEKPIFSTKSDGGVSRGLLSLDEIALERQRHILDVEDTLRRSQGLIARSKKFLEAFGALQERCAAGAED